MATHRHGPGCRDFRATRRSLFGRAREVIPIPADALDGLAEFERSGGLDRRDLLERGVGLWIGATALAGVTTRSVLEAAMAQAADAPDAPILVSLYLDGGNDGLNTLVPVTDPRYPELRTRVGLDFSTTLPLNDTDEFRWHPAAGGLRRLYDAGQMVVLPAVDYADPDLSHFNSARFWRTGIPEISDIETGWLGRALDVSGGTDNPLQGLGVSYSVDPILAADRAPTASIYDPNDFVLTMNDVWNEGFDEPWRKAIAGEGGSDAIAAVRAGYRTTFDVRDRVAALKLDADQEAPPTPEPYPDSDLGGALRNLARMLGAGLGTRVAAVSSPGGFDTHDSQPDIHAELIGDLGDSLAAFQADLDDRGLADRVLTLVWSEFGRRPEDNESRGTDHGAGGLVMLVGNRARGGIRSEFPGLAKLDREDNLKVTTEFPHLYATILEDHMGIEAGRVLPGVGGTRLPVIG